MDIESVPRRGAPADFRSEARRLIPGAGHSGWRLMFFSHERIATLAATMSVASDDLAAIFGRGESHSYAAGAFLFHESTPRLWMGIVEEGEIEIVRGNHGSATRLATLGHGTAFSEGALFDDLPHYASAVALVDSRVWQIPREVFETVREEKPDVFYRMLGHVARRLRARLEAANEHYYSGLAPVVATCRKEHDSLGVRELGDGLAEKALEFADVIKMGRTENQDAVPMTLGQEFGAYAAMIRDGIRHLERAGDELLEINMGATAIGTGINSLPGYAELCTRRLAEVSGLPVRLAENLVEATQDSAGFTLMSGAMKTTAVRLSKICNDLRWLSSGPRCGLYEIRLPAMQPGSSIMPGKVNPVIPEMVNQVCYQIIGADVTISMAAEAGELELNMAEPVIAFNLLFGLTLLRNAAITLQNRCISGIEANRDVCLAYVRNSIGLVTALNPVLGYERSAAIASEALATGGSVYDLVLAKGWLAKDQLDEILMPEKMTGPRVIRKTRKKAIEVLPQVGP
jgi:aspartate ammonia-lyase